MTRSSHPLRPWLAAVPAAWLLVACAPTSELQRPVPPVPATWPSTAGVADNAEASKIHWRSYFPDPQLHALIAAALQNNRDLRIAAGRVQEARAQYGMSRAEQLPQINLFGASDTTHTPSQLNTDGGSPTSRRLDISVTSVSYEVDFWGRLAGLTEAARASYLATEEAQRAVYLSLVADVASAYFTLVQTDELVRYARTTVDLRERSVVMIGKGRAIGAADDYVFQQAQGALEQASANQAALEYQQAAAANRLNYLLGNAPVVLRQGASLDTQGLDTRLAPGLPAEVLLLRPDVMAAEQRLQAAHANIGAARKAFLPKILLTAGLGFASQGLIGLFSRGAWSFSPTITLPLFDGGRLAASVDIAEARKVIAVAEYEKTIQQAFREVADLLSARLSLAQQLKASAANQMAQENRLRIAQLRYDAGVVSYLEVLDAQRDIVAAQQSAVQVRRAQLDAAAQLYKALGGGTQENAGPPQVLLHPLRGPDAQRLGWGPSQVMNDGV